MKLLLSRLKLATLFEEVNKPFHWQSHSECQCVDLQHHLTTVSIALY